MFEVAISCPLGYFSQAMLESHVNGQEVANGRKVDQLAEDRPLRDQDPCVTDIGQQGRDMPEADSNAIPAK